MKRYTWCGVMAAWLCGNVFAGPFTLPFKNQSTPLWQGWYYTDGSYHGGIDYGCAFGTEIVAVDDGYAWSWSDDIYSSYSWGHYVAIYHPSSGTYTLYAHLNSWESFIPRVSKSSHAGGASIWVNRGQRIGYSGKTGTIEPHLHFEVSVGAIGGANRRDAYGIYKMAGSYPGCGTNGSNTYYWTACAPVVYNSQYTCNGNPGSYVYIAKAGDFDGNGKQEPLQFYAGCGKWNVPLSNGIEFLPLKQWYCGLGIGSVAQMVGDVNGDNRDDAVILQNNSNGDIYVGLSTGTYFKQYYNAGNNLMRNMTNRFLADTNGDGKDDLVGYAASGNWYVALSNGFTFGTQFYANLSYGVNSSKRMLADVNGDKRMDAVIFYASTGIWVVALGQSNGTFGSPRNWETDHGKGASDWFVADINGDKRADAICFWNNVAPGWQGKIIIHESTGSSFAGVDTPRAIGHGTGSQKQLFADFTGDGKADFGFWFSASGWWVSKCDGWGFLPQSQW